MTASLHLFAVCNHPVFHHYITYAADKPPVNKPRNIFICSFPSGHMLHKMRFVAFPVTEYDEVLSGYQPGQIVERRKT
jgi:hypothetical protein